jgi:hypothetical protein
MGDERKKPTPIHSSAAAFILLIGAANNVPTVI